MAGSDFKINFKVIFGPDLKNTTCVASLHAGVTILSHTKPDNRSSSGH